MKLINGDSAIVLKDIPENSIDAVITDPPYSLIDAIKWDLQPSQEMFSEIYRVMKPGAVALIMTSSRQDLYTQLILNLKNSGFDISYSSLFWVYNNSPVKGRINRERGYIEGFNPRNAVEIITVAMKPFKGTIRSNIEKNGVPIVNYKEAHIQYGEGDNLTSNLLFDDDIDTTDIREKTYQLHRIGNWILDIPKPTRYDLNFMNRNPRDKYHGMFYKSRNDLNNEENHMTVKPVKLFAYLISAVTQRGMTVLDPFAGTGTAMIASYLTNRDCIAIEFNPAYVEMIKRRLAMYEISYDMIIY